LYDSREDTLNHIFQVHRFIWILISELQHKASYHDHSKLEEPEKPIFDQYTPRLKNTTYGSDEYKGYLNEMRKALDHHYKNNRHHPEHFSNGIRGMTLVDICEMLSDWTAATLRHDDGDIYESIKLNQTRFGYSDELMQIFINTVKEYFE
jgi:hypothetical protein